MQVCYYLNSVRFAHVCKHPVCHYMNQESDILDGTDVGKGYTCRCTACVEAPLPSRCTIGRLWKPLSCSVQYDHSSKAHMRSRVQDYPVHSAIRCVRMMPDASFYLNTITCITIVVDECSSQHCRDQIRFYKACHANLTKPAAGHCPACLHNRQIINCAKCHPTNSWTQFSLSRCRLLPKLSRRRVQTFTTGFEKPGHITCMQQ